MYIHLHDLKSQKQPVSQTPAHSNARAEIAMSDKFQHIFLGFVLLRASAFFRVRLRYSLRFEGSTAEDQVVISLR